MEIQQIRSATVLINYAGTKFIVDPWLQEPGTGFTATSPYPKKNIPSPLTKLPMSVESIMEGVEAIIVTHVHPDHFDRETAKRLDKSLPIFVQNERDKERVAEYGYMDIRILQNEGTKFKDVTLIKTPGMHGKTPELAAGEVCGVVFEGMNEKKLYVAGDTVWCSDVQNVINKYEPDVIVVNGCGAELLKNGLLIMDDKDVISVCKAAPNATIVVSHMDAVNHFTISREDMRMSLSKESLLDQTIIPEDGEIMKF